MFVEGKPRTVFFLQTLYLRYLSRRLKKLRMGECHAKCRALVKAINIFGWLNSDQHQGICCFLVLICFDWRGNSGNARKKTFFLQEGFPKPLNIAAVNHFLLDLPNQNVHLCMSDIIQGTIWEQLKLVKFWVNYGKLLCNSISSANLNKQLLQKPLATAPNHHHYQCHNT